MGRSNFRSPESRSISVILRNLYKGTVRFRKSVTASGPLLSTGRRREPPSALQRGFPGRRRGFQNYGRFCHFGAHTSQMAPNRCHHCVQGANLLQNGLGNAPRRHQCFKELLLQGPKFGLFLLQLQALLPRPLSGPYFGTYPSSPHSEPKGGLSDNISGAPLCTLRGLLSSPWQVSMAT